MIGFDCVLVVGPEHGRVFAEAGWSRETLLGELHDRLQIHGSELVAGPVTWLKGYPSGWQAGETLGKFRPEACCWCTLVVARDCSLQ